MMPLLQPEKKAQLIKWLGIPSAIFFIIILLTSGAYFAFAKSYENRIYPNVYVGRIKVGELTLAQAQARLSREADRLMENGIPMSIDNVEKNFMPIVPVAAGEATVEVIEFDTEKTAQEAFKIGHRDNFFQNFKERTLILFYNYDTTLAFRIDEDLAEKQISETFKEFENQEKNAILEVKESDGEVEFNILTSEAGRMIDKEKAVSELKANLIDFKSDKIILAIKANSPKLDEAQKLELAGRAKEIAQKAPINLLHEKQKWEINKARLAGFLTIDENNQLAYDKEKLKKYLDETIAKKINIEPVESKFQMSGGKMTKFQASKEGILLDIDASIAKLETEIASGTKDIVLITEVKKPAAGEDASELGIKELIGVGKSNFAGSPRNRVHNIHVGADAVNGRLIAPGEEFSLLKTLGKIDGSTGYKPELVIKDNKTVPEFGGGLCQIGTTVFRGATESGLPITQRRNHSYRVSYYEPAGTDATIYDPAPDFRFKNDTAHHILIQSRFEGTTVYFEFWGTKDGRKVEKTQPTIYNIVKPQPTKLIETADLKPGERKCTEKAHNGADAYFDYKVTYPYIPTDQASTTDYGQNSLAGTTSAPSTSSGQPIVKNVRFKSHYVPWREVCLIGIDKKASSTPAAVTASSTKASTATSTKKTD